MKIRVSSTTKAMVMGLMIAGANTAAADHDFTGEVKDAWLQGKVETVMALNSEVSAFAIDTEVEHGAVVLKGEVESEIDKELAARLAEGVEGIESVDNQLVVTGVDRMERRGEQISRDAEQAGDRIARNTDQAGDDIEREWDEATDEIEDEAEERRLGDRAQNAGNSLMSWVSDATTTATVKTKLMADSETEALKINVDTKDDVVILEGEVESESAKQKAEQIARDTGDVKEVRNNLRVVASN